jgi:hypothetical protein
LSHPYQSSFPVRHLCEHESTPFSLPFSLHTGAGGVGWHGPHGRCFDGAAGFDHLPAQQWATGTRAFLSPLLPTRATGRARRYDSHNRDSRGAKRGGCLLVVGGVS